MADIGCGDGLMCEPLAAQGARVTGVDAAANNIAAARAHAEAGALHMDCRVGEPEAALRHGEYFDVLLLLEVVEHVDDVQACMAYLPAIHRAWWTRSRAVNYIASFSKPAS